MKNLTLNKSTIDELSNQISMVNGGFTGGLDPSAGGSQQGCAVGLPSYPISCDPRDCCNGTHSCETPWRCDTYTYRNCA